MTTTIRARLCRFLLVLLAPGLVSCAAVTDRFTPAPQPDVLYTSVPELPAPLANGSIYQQQRGFLPLFEDRRPRRMGDILTIVLNERVNASANSSLNTTRSGNASLTLDQLPDVLDSLAEFGFDLSGESEFNGGGGSTANNAMTGTITVAVQGVMANGNLVVRGEKQISINQGTEYIRFSGVVDPRTISGQNTVPSTAVADARIEYTGDGYVNKAQQMGWLQRVFLTVSPF